MNAYLRSILRFWWLMVIGLAVAQLAAIVTVYKVDFSSIPPELSERSQPRYSAEGRLLVGDTELSYLRTTITRTVQPPTIPGEETPRAPIEVTQAPDNTTLTYVANLFPFLIESDQVAAVRRELYGVQPGAIKAQGITAVSTPSRFTPSQIPVIQLIGVGDTPKQAINIVKHTSKAFITWLTRNQDEQGLKPRERVVVRPVLTPVTAAAFGGASSTMPVLVFAIVLLSFVALAIFFDRLFPRRVISVVRDAESEAARANLARSRM